MYTHAQLQFLVLERRSLGTKLVMAGVIPRNARAHSLYGLTNIVASYTTTDIISGKISCRSSQSEYGGLKRLNHV